MITMFYENNNNSINVELDSLCSPQRVYVNKEMISDTLILDALKTETFLKITKNFKDNLKYNVSNHKDERVKKEIDYLFSDYLQYIRFPALCVEYCEDINELKETLFPEDIVKYFSKSLEQGSVQNEEIENYKFSRLPDYVPVSKNTTPTMQEGSGMPTMETTVQPSNYYMEK